MRSNSLIFISLTTYFLFINGNENVTENGESSGLSLSLDYGVYKNNVTAHEKAQLNKTSNIRTEEDSQYTNNPSDDAKRLDDIEIDMHNERWVSQNKWNMVEAATVHQITLSTTGNRSNTTSNTTNSVEVFELTDLSNKPYMESRDFRGNVTGSEQESVSHYSNSNDYDIEKKEPYSNNMKNSEEDSDMEFENIFEDLTEHGNNLNYMTWNGSKRQPKSVDLSFNFDGSDVLRNYETDYEKYKSPGIESESLVVEGKKSHKVVSGTAARATAENHFRTTKLLTSNLEVNEESSFVISKSNSRGPTQLELQDDGLTKITSTHEDAVSRLAIDETIYVLPSLIVELAEGGNSLWLNPNIRQDLYYEVTNNLNSAVQIRFKVTDERSILWTMDKYNVYLSPHDTVRVRLTVIPRVDVNTDRIVFNAIGAETVHKEAIVHVNNKNARSDDSSPLVDYSYTSDCTDVGLADCHKGTWTIKVSARDQGSGLMLLTTIPKGIYFPDGYTAGTTEEVTGYFSDTCCNPDLQIIAVDSLNNRIVKQANAYSAPLSFWAIIAIVLAVLIILVIIIAIVIYCVKKYKKSQAGSFDLPTYRGRSRF